ncbi:MAG: RluA family pseudouridine synthase [Polyangiaceae bacterium]
MTRIRAKEADFVRPADVDPEAIVSVFRVPPEAAGMRLDLFLQSQLRRTSRSRTQQIIALSAYDDTGKHLRGSDRVRSFAYILLWRAPWDETPVPQEIPILYEDDHILAVDKPAGLPVHPTARYHKNTLIKMIEAARPGAYLHLAHRIDRETSGVLLLAKNHQCDRTLKKQFEERDEVEKTYVALTWGNPLNNPQLSVQNTTTGTGSFRHVQPLELDRASRFKVKMRVAKPESPNALHASTVFHVEDSREKDGKLYARVSCNLETGRQHQIRVHLASLGTPIVGDKLYGPDETAFARGADGELTPEDEALLELPRHALHAMKMRLRHPITGESLTIDAPLPSDLAAFWKSLAPIKVS